MLKKNDHVDVDVNKTHTHGRIAELVPPNCAKVYIIPQKYYALVKLEHLTLRPCEGPRNHNKGRAA